MRQHRQLRRQTLFRQRLRDVRLPAARALHARAESICLAELEADVLGRLDERFGRHVSAPQMADALVFGRQRRSSGRDAVQRGDVFVALGVHHRLAFARRRLGREAQRLVDDGEIALIVQEARVGVHLGVDAHPELHIALELGRPGDERIRHGERSERQPRQKGKAGPGRG